MVSIIFSVRGLNGLLKADSENLCRRLEMLIAKWSGIAVGDMTRRWMYVELCGTVYIYVL
jgi:hypothetical protein